MSEQPAVMTAEWVEPETPFEKKRKRITYQCPRCEHIYVRIFNAEPKHDPPCPNKSCVQLQELKSLKVQMANLQRMLEEGRGPAQVGANIRVRAVDETAKIVMEDNQMTDLRDGLRPGDIAAPPLPPKLQSAADNFFGGPKTVIGNSQQKSMAQKRAEMLGRRAIAGAFRDVAIRPSEILPPKRPAPTILNNSAYERRS